MTNYVTTADDGNYLKNERGTSARTCSCGSWIEHWKNYTGRDSIPRCIVPGCNNIADVGAHVQFTAVKKREGLSYIAPMCTDHNNDHDLEFKSKPNYRLARANVSETCGS